MFPRRVTGHDDAALTLMPAPSMSLAAALRGLQRGGSRGERADVQHGGEANHDVVAAQ